MLLRGGIWRNLRDGDQREGWGAENVRMEAWLEL